MHPPTLKPASQGQSFSSAQFTDPAGNPAGGISTGRGFTIAWQNGPLGAHSPDCFEGECDPDCKRIPPNGAFVEDVIIAAIDRLEFYQASKFNCKANADALSHLKCAIEELNSRTADRTARKVEGTHAQ